MKNQILNKIALLFLEHIPLFQKLSPVMFKILILFERFFPVVISIVLNRIFRGLKSEGKISKYQVNVIRKNKLQYKIEIGVALTYQQIDSALRDMTSGRAKQFKTIEDIKKHFVENGFCEEKEFNETWERMTKPRKGFY